MNNNSKEPSSSARERLFWKLFCDLKDERDRQEVLDALRQRVKDLESSKSIKDMDATDAPPAVTKWDWAKHSFIVGVDEVKSDGSGIIVRAQRSLGKQTRVHLCFLSWDRIDQVYADNWPIIFEEVCKLDPSIGKYEHVSQTRFWKQSRNKWR